MLDGENRAAIDLARWAQSMARTLGVPEALSDALNTEGCALFAQDESEAGGGKLREALRVAIGVLQEHH